MNDYINAGALAILGYWLVYGLPALLRDVQDRHHKVVTSLIAVQVEDRKANAVNADKISTALAKLSDVIHNDVKSNERRTM